MEPKTRVCKYCETRYPIEKFGIANIVKGKEYRRWKCKKCNRKTKNVRRKKITTWIQSIKAELSCKKCGEDDFRVLDFHHNGDKDVEIANTLSRGWGKEKILKEIQKCDVLCCKCHRIHHWEKRYGA